MGKRVSLHKYQFLYLVLVCHLLEKALQMYLLHLEIY